MVVFLACLMLCKAKPAIRMATLFGFAWYCLAIAHWDTFLFVSGILLAELHLVRKEAASATEDPLNLIGIKDEKTTKLTDRLSQVFWALVFVAGLYLGSWPCEKASETPGLMTLDSLTPKRYGGTEENHGYFWYSIAAVMIMLAFENLPILQRPFNTSVARYLGDISFAFYIIHWTFLWTVGRVITNEAMVWFGEHWGFAASTVIVFPLTICVADVYWRLFENGSVNLSRWLWDQCSVAEDAGDSERSRTIV
jgi:hypothetical protein